jgi:hypothetical protein
MMKRWLYGFYFGVVAIAPMVVIAMCAITLLLLLKPLLSR